MANGETANQIIADAKAARQTLGELERQLQEEIDEIRRKAVFEGRDMTQDEHDLRDERKAQLAKARKAFQDLVFVNLQRLDNSDDVKQMQAKMNEINVEIADDLAKLKRIERHAQTAAKIADVVAKATAKLAELAAKAPM